MITTKIFLFQKNLIKNNILSNITVFDAICCINISWHNITVITIKMLFLHLCLGKNYTFIKKVL